MGRKTFALLIACIVALVAITVWIVTKPTHTDARILRQAQYQEHLDEYQVKVGSRAQYLGNKICDQLNHGIAASDVERSIEKTDLIDPWRAQQLVHWAGVDLCP